MEAYMSSDGNIPDMSEAWFDHFRNVFWQSMTHTISYSLYELLGVTINLTGVVRF